MAAPNQAREINLEQFLINRFGRELYLLFFKSLHREGLGRAVQRDQRRMGRAAHQGSFDLQGHRAFFQEPVQREVRQPPQKDTETSLIERFLYPKHGPGQLWEYRGRVRQVTAAARSIAVGMSSACMSSGRPRHQRGGRPAIPANAGTFTADYFFSTMPIKELIRGIDDAPSERREVSEGLQYRDFITVGVLLKAADRG